MLHLMMSQLHTVCGMSADVVPIKPHQTQYDGHQGKTVVRTGFPMVKAYAVTVHKSQGMSLDSMVVNVSDFWEPGQAYVAMSRCDS